MDLFHTLHYQSGDDYVGFTGLLGVENEQWKKQPGCLGFSGPVTLDYKKPL